MRRSIISAILCLASLASLHAQTGSSNRPWLPLDADATASLDLDLSPAQLETLRTKGEITRYPANPKGLSLCPDSALTAELIPQLEATKPNVVIEALFAFPLPPALATASDRDLAIYRILHRFRSMAGIKYYSSTWNQVRVFFVKSSLVTGPDKLSPIPDPVPASIDNAKTLWALQEDSTFGENLYQVDLRSLGDQGFHLRMRNAKQVWYGIVPVLDPMKLDMHLLAQVRGSTLVFYGSTAVNVPQAFGMADKARSSFYNRMVAMYDWFVGELKP